MNGNIVIEGLWHVHKSRRKKIVMCKSCLVEPGTVLTVSRAALHITLSLTRRVEQRLGCRRVDCVVSMFTNVRLIFVRILNGKSAIVLLYALL